VTDSLERMASIVREDPSVTVKELARRMGFAEQKSVYYWLGKQKFRGLKEFKRAVLAQRHSAKVEDGGKPAALPGDAPETPRQGSHRLMSVPVASGVSRDGQPVWSQDTIHIELPGRTSSSVYAVRIEPPAEAPYSQEWLIVDPLESPRDGSLALCVQKDGMPVVCRTFVMGQTVRYFGAGGYEILCPAVAGVVKARLQYCPALS
jgi:hypothetical protein